MALQFVLGLFIGSFLNVLIDRLPRNESIVGGRSYCESCKKQLQWYDLFPVLSFLFLSGKCRYCNSQIPLRLPLVELITGITFVVVFALIPLSMYVYTPFFLLIACLFIAIFFIDSINQIIPDTLLIICVGLILLLHISVNNNVLYYSVVGLCSALFFFLLFVITKGRGMGFGDVKFAFVIGFLLGFPMALFAFYAAFLSGAVVSIFLIITKKKKLKGSKIAFGPFMIVGIVAALLFSESIMKILF